MDSTDKGRVLLAAGATDTNCTHMADGLLTGTNTDRASLRFVNPTCSDDVDVEENQTLIDENVAAAVIKAGNCRIGVVSVYLEGDQSAPYLDRIKWVCSKLGTNKVILGGDVNAWSVWWGSDAMTRECGLCDFFDMEGFTYSTREYPDVRSIQGTVYSKVRST
ncbi:hypothetical protein EVAR_23343_1 [Eumeta japonica]|uniref:Endonuclease/exonuclease/phosphatase domain-containing protein n=1 Tax=Eumeta variegata TaxID=151549 RepID=A0A4C1Y053_EUMVA|nr:hypothetical protein EVAR_23343_1 [Eumeta japonica]